MLNNFSSFGSMDSSSCSTFSGFGGFLIFFPSSTMEDDSNNKLDF
jgi:hypothetical protein